MTNLMSVRTPNWTVLVTSVIGLFVVVSISGNITLNVTLSVVRVGTTGGDTVAEMKKEKKYALEINSVKRILIGNSDSYLFLGTLK